MEVRFFPDAGALRRWFERHHAAAPELWVGFYRKDTGRTGVTYSEALDEALCFGWIDGVRKRVDDISYTNRFSPRQRRSVWSRINIARVEALIAAGRMTPAGLAAFEARRPERTGLSSLERQQVRFDRALAAAFRTRRAAWQFFQAQPPGYQRMATWWVTSAVRPETRERRLEQLIEISARGLRLGAGTGSAARETPGAPPAASRTTKVPAGGRSRVRGSRRARH